MAHNLLFPDHGTIRFVSHIFVIIINNVSSMSQIFIHVFDNSLCKINANVKALKIQCTNTPPQKKCVETKKLEKLKATLEQLTPDRC